MVAPCDVVAYTSLLLACERAGDWAMATTATAAATTKQQQQQQQQQQQPGSPFSPYSVRGEMARRGVRPNAHTFATLLQTAAASAEKAAAAAAAHDSTDGSSSSRRHRQRGVDVASSASVATARDVLDLLKEAEALDVMYICM